MPSGEEYDLDLMVVPPAEDIGECVHVGSLDLGPFRHGEAALRATTQVIVRVHRPAGAHSEARVHIGGVEGLLYAKTMVACYTPNLEREIRAKHLYDIYALARTYPNGQRALAERLRQTLNAEQIERMTIGLGIAFEPGGDGALLVAEILGAGGASPEMYLNQVEITMRRLVRDLGEKAP
jgi:hypothetical protein